MKKEIPTTKIDRTKVLVKGAFQVGTKKIKRPFLSEEKKEEIDDEIANILFEKMSFLKGTAIKMSQILSLHNLIPPNMQKKLEKSYNNVTPLSKVLVIKTLKNELQKEYGELFDEFDLKPFASASLGQVHFAKVQDKKLAIKIQYPNIDKTIQNDIKLIKSFTKLKKFMNPILEEIEDRLNEEVDYILEAKNTKEAYKNFVNKNIIVPKVYKKYSTKHILCTSYIKGLDLNSWLKTNPSNKEKTKIANMIYSVFIKSVFKYNTLQADPNPANYIITPNNKLALIDFGCVKRFENSFVSNIKKLYSTYNIKDKKATAKIHKEVGFIKNENQLTEKIFNQNILPFNNWMLEPFEKNEFLFTKEYLDRGIEFANMFSKIDFFVIKDFVFFDRTQHGLFSLFSKINVKIDMREAINEIFS